jgi:hypothetical protein
MTLNTDNHSMPFLARHLSISKEKWKQGFPVYTSQVKEGVYKPLDKTANRKIENN